MKRAVWFLLAVGVVVAGLLTYELSMRGAAAGKKTTVTATSDVPTVTVERRTISARTKVDGTLGYAGNYAVVNQLAGYFTWLPRSDEATVMSQGDVLYRIGELPVVLLAGSIPAWRDLSPGVSGSDVKQLNDDLIALGLLDRAALQSENAFGSTTKDAVIALQRKIGAEPSGFLPLGDVVFLPAPIRVVSVVPALGARAAADSVIMKATSTSRQAAAHLTASQLERVKIGDDVTITLNLGGPNERVVPGRISRISNAADTGSGANGNIPTFEVDVAPVSSAPLGAIDQMPCQVGITTTTAENALVVPVTALLSTPGQTYSVEVLKSGGARNFVPVTLGVFDDAEGVVQVIGDGLSAGDKVVVPSL